MKIANSDSTVRGIAQTERSLWDIAADRNFTYIIHDTYKYTLRHDMHIGIINN